MRILNTIVDVKAQDEASDLHVWQWLQNLIETLGEDGMSSEESENDTHGSSIESVCRPRIMEWRRDIEEELRIIDAQRHLDKDIFSPRGAKPVTRIRNSRNPISTRKPKPGLPRPLYDDEWINGKSETYLEKTLKVSEGKFLWMKVEARGAR